MKKEITKLPSFTDINENNLIIQYISNNRDKINEIIDRLNSQEQIELPEPVMRETIKPAWGDTELVFNQDISVPKDFLTEIVHNIILNNDLDLATEEIVDLLIANKKESEIGGTEKLNEEDSNKNLSDYIDKLFGTGHNGIWSVGMGDIIQLKEYIKELLEEKENELQETLGEITVADSRIREIEQLLKKILKYFEEYQSDYLTEREEIHQAQELQGEIERLLSKESN